MRLTETEQRRRDLAVAQVRMRTARTPEEKALWARMAGVAQRNVQASLGQTVEAPKTPERRTFRPVRVIPVRAERRDPEAPRHVEAPKPEPVRSILGPATCACGDGIPLGRRKLGYRTCLDCGSEKIKFMVMEVPKSNAIVTADPKNLKGVSGSHKGRGFG